MSNEIQHVFLVGAKNLGWYGGYETFVDKLTEYHRCEERLQYHVACKANGEGRMDETRLKGAVPMRRNQNGIVTEFTYHNARCFKISVPPIGPAQAIYYDIAALQACCRYIKAHRITHPIIYIMTCRIGPAIGWFSYKIHKSGGKIYLNPDGHEWMRTKWNPLVRRYWKFSESMMVRKADLVVCDSRSIEHYIQTNYHACNNSQSIPPTRYIAYGAEVDKISLPAADAAFQAWCRQHDLHTRDYYLIVSRFVPENNFETILREYMASHSRKPLVIITEVNRRFWAQLHKRLAFSADGRIKFVGTVFDQNLLHTIRQNAYGYLHGHEVGGTNPSLLEALSATPLNLVLDVSFNREVAQDAALYWTKQPGSLASLVNACDELPPGDIAHYASLAQQRIGVHYSWQLIADQYEALFLAQTSVKEETK